MEGESLTPSYPKSWASALRNEQADRGPDQERKRYIQWFKSLGDYPHRFMRRWHFPSARSIPPPPSCAPVRAQPAGFPLAREVRIALDRIWPPWAPNGRGVPVRNLWPFPRALARLEAGHPK